VILHCSIGDDGWRGDGVLRCSGLLQYLWNNAIFHGFVVLGDSVYPTNDVMISIFKGLHLPLASIAFNVVMCPMQTSVGWGYLWEGSALLGILRLQEADEDTTMWLATNVAPYSVSNKLLNLC
jgi:hypothetical protein